MCLTPINIPIKRKKGDTIIYDGRQDVACGKCLQCLQRRADEWAYRCMLEASLYPENCFITLTYNDDCLPVGGNLCRRDLQLFNKRLREFISPKKIRLFYCGEYGKRGLRPHYHEIIFGWQPDDLYFFKKDNGVNLFRSPTIEKLWSLNSIDYAGSIGFSSVGELTFESARYCAKYLQKLSPLPYDLTPPFVGMSNRPGIGYGKISPQILLDGCIYYRGKSIPIPRYFLKILSDGHDLSSFKESRIENARARALLSDPYHKISREKSKKLFEKLLTKDKI